MISEAIAADHEELRGLVGEGFRGIGREGVEVHIVPNRSRWAISGRAWPELPVRRARSQLTRYLVQIEMPRKPSAAGYPFSWRYPKRKTAPEMTASDWRERLLAVAAHEAYHVKQFRSGMRRSEVTAERWAVKVLTRYRQAETR